METRYVVFSGPGFPSAVHVSPLVDFCLVAQVGCQMDVLLTRVVPEKYEGSWKTRMRNVYKKELEGYAAKLNGGPKDVVNSLLMRIKAEFDVQLTVADATAAAKYKATQASNKAKVLTF